MNIINPTQIKINKHSFVKENIKKDSPESNINFIYKSKKSQLQCYGYSCTKIKILETYISEFYENNGKYNLKDIWVSFDNDKNYTEDDLDKILDCFEIECGGYKLNRYIFGHLKILNVIEKQCIFIKEKSIIIHFEIERINLSNIPIRFIFRVNTGHKLSDLKNFKYHILYEETQEIKKGLQLYNQIQFTGIEKYTGKLAQVRLNFNHPCSVLLFYVTDQNKIPLKNFIKNVKITLNDKDYIDNSLMDIRIAMRDYGFRNDDNGIYYAIPLGSLFNTNNTLGTINMSRINTIIMKITLKKTSQGFVHVSCKNTNVLRADSNQIGLVFAA